VALAYPAVTPELSSHVAKEAFIEALEDPQLQLKLMEREPKLVEDALNIATRLEAYEASLAPRHYDRGGGDHKHKPKLKSTYAVEGEEMPTLAKGDDRIQIKAQIERQLADLQVQCNENREALGRLKEQKEAAERRATAATKAAEAVKSAPPPPPANPAPSQGGSANGQYRSQRNYRGGAVVGSRRIVMMLAITVVGKGIGPGIARQLRRHHWHRRRHRHHHHWHQHQQVEHRQ